MPVFRFSLTLCMALLLSACLPVTTKNAVGMTKGLSGDPALEGVWRADDKNGEAGAIIFLRNDDGSLTAIVTSQDGSGHAESWQRFLVRTATLGAHTFLNAREIESGGKIAEDGLAGEIIPILYTAGTKTLTLELLDESKVREAIKAGSIAGAIEPGEFGDVHLTADANSLDAFMQTDAGVALFDGKPIVLRKIL